MHTNDHNDGRPLPVGGLVLLIAGAAVVIGSFMPWIKVRVFVASLSVSGTEGDGVFTAAAGAAIVGAGIYYMANRRLPRQGVMLAALAAVIAGAVAVFDAANIHDKAAEVNSRLASASVGPGLWVVIIGAVGSAIGAAVAHDEQRKLAPPAFQGAEPEPTAG